jgi:hypothetical protein
MERHITAFLHRCDAPGDAASAPRDALDPVAPAPQAPRTAREGAPEGAGRGGGHARRAAGAAAARERLRLIRERVAAAEAEAAAAGIIIA